MSRKATKRTLHFSRFVRVHDYTGHAAFLSEIENKHFASLANHIDHAMSTVHCSVLMRVYACILRDALDDRLEGVVVGGGGCVCGYFSSLPVLNTPTDTRCSGGGSHTPSELKQLPARIVGNHHIISAFISSTDIRCAGRQRASAHTIP